MAELDPDRRLFGAAAHGYRPNPPCPIERVEAVERALGMRLPAGYRTFVTEVADGGAGPYYGVLPLGAAIERIEDLGSARVLAVDSPLDTDIDLAEILDAPHDPAEHAARLDRDPAYRAAWGEQHVTYSSDPWLNGRLPLADYGCGDWFFLVVKGPRRGAVWVDSMLEGATGIDDLHVDFPTWYERWSAEYLRRVAGEVPAVTDGAYPALEFGENPRRTG